jgi:uncharacterized membrane protein
MTAAPLWQAAAPVLLHALAALAAILLGAVQLSRPKGGPAHRAAGATWVAAMALVAGSAFWMGEGGWSPLHALALGTLGSLAFALWALHAGRGAVHGRAMQWVYAMALIVTGLFALMPGRLLHAVVFGGG